MVTSLGDLLVQPAQHVDEGARLGAQRDDAQSDLVAHQQSLPLERLSQLPSGPEGDPLGRWERMVGRGRLRIPPAAREGTGAPWPRITCLGTFYSGPRSDQHLVSQGRDLKALWFQDDWAPPVAREVLQTLVDLGWENVSEDLSSREDEW